MECSAEDVSISSMDVGVMGGIGLEINRVRFDLTYTIGLSDAIEEDGDDLDDDDSVSTAKNRFSIQAGFIIPVGS